MIIYKLIIINKFNIFIFNTTFKHLLLLMYWIIM